MAKLAPLLLTLKTNRNQPEPNTVLNRLGKAGLFPFRCTNLLDHLLKLLFFIFLKGFVVLHRGDVQLMLGLGLRGLKRACEDGNFNIFQDLKNKNNNNNEIVTHQHQHLCPFQLICNVVMFVPLASAGD